MSSVRRQYNRQSSGNAAMRKDTSKNFRNTSDESSNFGWEIRRGSPQIFHRLRIIRFVESAKADRNPSGSLPEKKLQFQTTDQDTPQEKYETRQSGFFTDYFLGFRMST